MRVANRKNCPKSDEDYKKQKFKVKNTYTNSDTANEEELYADDQAIKDCPDDYTLIKKGEEKVAKLFLKVTCKGDKKHKKEFLDEEEFKWQ